MTMMKLNLKWIEVKRLKIRQARSWIISGNNWFITGWMLSRQLVDWLAEWFIFQQLSLLHHKLLQAEQSFITQVGRTELLENQCVVLKERVADLFQKAAQKDGKEVKTKEEISITFPTDTMSKVHRLCFVFNCLNNPSRVVRVKLFHNLHLIYEESNQWTKKVKKCISKSICLINLRCIVSCKLRLDQ